MSATESEIATLTPSEEMRLTELESTVDRGKRSWIEVGIALNEIRSANLYRKTHGDFGAYVRDRFGMSWQTANRLRNAAVIARSVEEVVQLTAETQARALDGLGPYEARAVVRRAQESTDGKLTARAIKMARAELEPGSRPCEVIELHPGLHHADEATGKQVTEDALDFYLREEESITKPMRKMTEAQARSARKHEETHSARHSTDKTKALKARRRLRTK